MMKSITTNTRSTVFLFFLSLMKVHETAHVCTQVLRFELAVGLVSPEAAARRSAEKASQQAEEEEEAPVNKEELKADPVLGKFVKMAAMGVPAPSVVHRMVVEGLPPSQVTTPFYYISFF